MTENYFLEFIELIKVTENIAISWLDSILESLKEHAEVISKNSTKESIQLNSANSVNNNTGDKVKLF